MCMKTARLLFLSALALGSGLAAAQSPAPAEVTPPQPAADATRTAAMADTENFIMHYYQHPQPERIAETIAQLAKLFPSAEDCPAQHALAVFFGEVFRANPEREEEWMQAISGLPADWQEFFQWSLRYSRGEEADVSAEMSLDPNQLDACWGGFMATGAAKYPEYVLRVACLPGAPYHVDTTIQSANWSCASFITNSPEMRSIARNWFATASEEQRQNFAMRTHAQVQDAVFGKVLLSEEQKEALHQQRQQAAEQMQELAAFFQQYGQQPQPERISTMLALHVELDPEATYANPATLRQFFGEVFRANPDRVEEWARAIATYPAPWQEQLGWALRYARGEEEDATQGAPTSATALACMGGYMASADRKYLRHLFHLACEAKDADAREMALYLALGCVDEFDSAREVAEEWLEDATAEQMRTLTQQLDEEMQQALFGRVTDPLTEPAQSEPRAEP